MRLVLIRHGESEWNAAGRWQGQGDPSLSARGREQVARLAEALAPAGIDVLVSSDLARAQETASILSQRLACPIETDARLRELDIGRWTGRTRAEIVSRDPEALRFFETGDRDAHAGAAERRRDVGVRAQAALREIRARHAGRCVALVTHLGVLRELLPGRDFDNAEWRSVSAADLSPPPAAAAPVRRAAH